MNLATHNKRVKSIASQIKVFNSSNKQKKIRFTHGSTNSTRVQDKSNYHLIDISKLDQIIKIDTHKKVAIVEPNVPMDRLVDACLEKGFIPKVVMEFPGITVGGGVNGAALEASSFRYGQFNDTCIAYELILGDGEIIVANKKENAELFYGISGSYGTLALLTLITFELLPAKQYVEVSFTPVLTASIVEVIKKRCKSNYDYVEGLIYNKKSSLLITGKLTDIVNHPIKTLSKASDEWFYLFARKQLLNGPESTICVPLKEYLFRYNRGAFWMGKHAFEAYHVPFNRLTRLLLNSFMNTRTMYRGLHETNFAQNFFVQDFYLPLSQTNKFLDLCMNKLGIYPLWLCPLKATQNPQKLSPHFLKEKLLIDVGIWGKPRGGNKKLEKINEEFECYLRDFKGRKMFYADSFYTEQVFWKIYDKKWYLNVRSKYRAEGIFPTLLQKVHTKKRYKVQKWKILKTMAEVFF